MATASSMEDAPPESLKDLLSACLPENVELNYYHISTPPTRCTPLFSPPPTSSPSDKVTKQAKAQRTYCESHSLLLTFSNEQQSTTSDSSEPSQVAVFAIEVQIFTTATLTTVFISKADSTGWLSLLPNPSSRSTILKSVAATFVSWIIRQRHRSDRNLVLSLFARAQNQYLFPGSSDNGKKHVLDDRALVKWWCKILDPILREYSIPRPSDPLKQQQEPESNGSSVRSKAHLIVPGHDAYETQAFYPPTARLDPVSQKRWVNAYPVNQVAPFPNAPPRCLVPHFPDDPKARFLHELDDELSTAPQPNRSASALKHESPTKRGQGQWRSVKTLEQFWEMMAFRQECSSGRLVGFIWITFAPTSPTILNHDNDDISPPPSPSRRSSLTKTPKPTPKKPTSSNKPNKKRTKRSTFRTSRASKKANKKLQNWKKKKPKGPIPLRVPRVKSTLALSSKDIESGPITTKYFYSPLHARGTLILTDKAYNRMHELFLRLDFKNLEASKASTRRWIQETSVVGAPNPVFTEKHDDLAAHKAGDVGWGKKVTGRREIETGTTTTANGAHATAPASFSDGITMLSVKRKRKEPEPDTGASGGNVPEAESAPALNGDGAASANGSKTEPQVLAAGLVRKKAKVDDAKSHEIPSIAAPAALVSEGVNVLGSGLVRKKPKA